MFEGVKFRQLGEDEKKQRKDEHGKFTMGEVPDDLAFVVEKGEVEFEIVKLLLPSSRAICRQELVFREGNFCNQMIEARRTFQDRTDLISGNDGSVQSFVV